MKFYKHLYVGEKIKDPIKVKWKLRTGAGQSIYVICTANGNDQLEIMHSGYLKQKYFRFHSPIIIGIANDYDEAVDVVVGITKECLEKTSTCNIKDYLKQKAKGNI